MLNRRQFVAGSAALGVGTAINRPAIASAKPKVVIIGGGPAGGSVLRALAAAAPGKIGITLIEAQPVYMACFQSNLYLGGFLPFDRFTFTFDAVQKLDDVTVINDTAEALNRATRTITLRGGNQVPYDLLVVSPGIDLDYASVPGWSKQAEERMPHAYKGGAQLKLLKRQLDGVPDGGLIVMIAPPNPYRCPPGPYERASMMAHILKAGSKSNSRIVILDAKEEFSKQVLFEEGWRRHYPGAIEWLPPSIHGGIKSVDPATMTVETGFETYTNAALVNVIPRQRAGVIAQAAGLAGVGGYCLIDAFTMKSREDPRIFVVGDACIPGDMPKSAFAASSQAQVAAQAIRTELLQEAQVEAEYRNTCWSLIDSGDSVKIGGVYKPTPQKIRQATTFISKLDDSPDTRGINFVDSAAWYSTLTAELYS
jgi:NADPH-dependent 2,4-dienoyl-CoA reductase/sulfur reductase-like enzyme